LTAADLMSRDVVMVPEKMSARAAAQLLSREQISGAPVVNLAGRCVGVLSATDFMHQAVADGRPRLYKQPEAEACACSEWQVMDLERLPLEEVSSYMTADPVTTAPHTTIGELARMMLEAHIHRIIVVDQDRRPIGVVSTTDILAALARADRAC
jgi:CBS domain-containing protein